MTFKVTYHRDKKRRGKPVREGFLRKMGDWRSRWERKRDIDRRDPRKDQIKRIFSQPTDKDYIVKRVYGVSPDNLYFKAVPVPDPSPPKGRRNFDKVEVRSAERCVDCGNYLRKLGGRLKKLQKYSTTSKSKSKSPKNQKKKGNSKK